MVTRDIQQSWFYSHIAQILPSTTRRQRATSRRVRQDPKIVVEIAVIPCAKEDQSVERHRFQSESPKGAISWRGVVVLFWYPCCVENVIHPPDQVHRVITASKSHRVLLSCRPDILRRATTTPLRRKNLFVLTFPIEINLDT